MSQLELLRIVLQNLVQVGAQCMLVGSYAASYHGEGRSTHDVDLVVEFKPDQIDSFIGAFDRERYYLSKLAYGEGRMAIVIDTRTGDKVDLFILQDDADARREFSRRRPGKIFDLEIDIATAEDAILSKLRWDEMIGGSQVQRNDVRDILMSQQDLDFDYLRTHATPSTLETLEEILSEIADK